MSYEDGGMPAGGNSRFRGYPARMSERQQLALILQMTSQEMTSGSSNRTENSIASSNSRSSPLQHQKNSKSRWSNKNAESLEGNTSLNRHEDRFRLANGCETKERSEFAGSNSPDGVRTATGAESPVAAGSPAESAATVIPAESNSSSSTASSKLAEAVSSEESGDKGVTTSSSSQQHHHQEEAAVSPCEMRKVVDKQSSQIGASGSSSSGSGTGGSTSSSTSSSQQHQQSSSGGRVTLRLNQVRSARDEKKVTASVAGAAPGTANAGGVVTAAVNTTTRQTGAAASGSSSSTNLSSIQMEPSSTKSSISGGSSSAITNAASTNSGVVSSGGGSGGTGNNSNNGSSSSSADGGDVYEFKSSKEATPVRGSSTSPNPNPEKDSKDSNTSALSSSAGAQAQGSSATSSTTSSSTGSTSGVGSGLSMTVSSSTSSGIGSSSASSSGLGTSAEGLSSSIGANITDEPMMTSSSPQSSSSPNKRSYDNDSAQDDQDEESRKRKKKENETNKDGAGMKGAAGGRQIASRSNSNASDKSNKSGKQPSPSSSVNANSPKPSPGNNSKGNTESDGEDDRSKNSDCNLAPKVPPLKLVVQNTNSEPEQGNRNGKNTSNRGHQIHYVVASSNSNDSMDKDQIMSGGTSGATSPLDGSGVASKNEEKKDFSGALDGESRSTHHQRVLRSSHRSGNGSNGNTGGREPSGNSSGNGNYSNSSPLSVNAADRSNNSSPQRYNSPTPDSGRPSEAGKSVSTDSSSQNSPAVKSGNTADKNEKSVEIKKEPGDISDTIKKENTSDTPGTSSQVPVEFHPRKRKIKTSKETQQAAAAAAATAAVNETTEVTNIGSEIHPHDQPITNCIQLFINIRKQIQQRRKGLFPVKPKPPQGFKNYLLNKCSYTLAGNASDEPNINLPSNLPALMKDLYVTQEKERYSLRIQHVVEKEKLVLAKEQEIIRVHGRAARALANQELPFSVCTFLKDEEVYNLITPEQEEKDRNARSRYTGRMFISWLQDVDDKWEKIKEAMILRHHNEAESLHAVQRMDWEWKLKEVGLCEFKATPNVEKLHVPIVHVSDDFDLLPA